MSNQWMRRALLRAVAVLVPMSALVGCVGQIPVELTNADKAIAAAKAAGKDKDCPDEFNAADRLKQAAFDMCRRCDTAKAIAIANESLAKSKDLCPAKPAPAPAPAPAAVVPPPAPAIAVTLAANPPSIKEGECSALLFTSSNASSVTIDQGVGSVEPNGSRKVCPGKTTSYAIVATGTGGTANASATVTVVPRVIDRLAIHVNFDFDKATPKKVDEAELEKGREFLKKYPGFKVSLEGHTDSIGPDAYNQKLSEKRAASVKEWLVSKKVDGSKIQTSGFGKTKPIADNKTKAGRAENRRVEVLILSE
jgi:outer membrane protein OmpA-like peptidoglycan-associated protein